jgi:XTP/dITP diphosphohydrolase
MKQILAGLPYELISLDKSGLKEEIEETGNSFEENARLKAVNIGEKTGVLTLAEDSGLVIDVLGGRPGIFSARYTEGSDKDRIDKILEELEDIPKEKKTARFIAVAAIYDPKDSKLHTFKGISEGLIIDRPLGNNGFGYDPIFYNLDLKKTNAEASLEEKNRVSHRAKALFQAKKYLEKLAKS